MKKDLQEYSRNLLRYFELAKVDYDAFKSVDEVLAKLDEVTAEKKKIKDSNDRFLEEHLYRLEKNISLMTDQDVQDLAEIFNSLRSEHSYFDRVISYRISRLLFKYNLEHEKWNSCVRQLFFMAFLYCTITDHSQDKEMDDYSIIVEGIMQGYFEYLDDEAKLVAIATEFFCTYYPIDRLNAYKRFNRAEYFLEKYHINVNDKNFSLFYSYRGSVLDALVQMMDAVRMKLIKPEDLDVETTRRLMKITQDHLDKNEYPHLAVTGRFVIKQCEFFLGDISYKEITEFLRELFYTAEEGSDTIDVSLIQYKIPSLLIDLVWNYSGKPEEERVRICNEIINCVLKRKPVDDKVFRDNFYLRDGISEFVTSASRNMGFKRTRDFVFNWTVKVDRSLFVHTVIVKEISSAILEWIFKNNPEYLDGVTGKDWKYIAEHKDDYYKLMEDCALYHDIGKFYCLDFVSNSSRQLTEDEHRMIQYHPLNFDEFFSNENDTEFNCIRDCARLHHRWFDESAGYPKEHFTQNKPFVSILTVADCTDAATDLIGRPYAVKKALNELPLEFETQGGNRYDPFVLEVIKKPEVYEKVLGYISKEHRISLYNFHVES